MKVEYQSILKRGLFLILIFIVIQNILMRIVDVPTSPNMGYNVYFNIENSSRSIFYTILLIIFIPTLVLIYYYDDYHNKHEYMSLLRIGHKRYYVKALCQIFLATSILRFLIEVIFLLQVHYLKSNIDFNTLLDTHAMFGNYALQNIVLFLITCSLGTGIFSCFWYSIIYFIKNKYIYRGIMILWLFIAMMIFAMIYSFISGFIGTSDSLYSIILGISPVSLLGPGTVDESHGLLNFLSGFIIYSIATFMLIKVTFRKKFHYG